MSGKSTKTGATLARMKAMRCAGELAFYFCWQCLTVISFVRAMGESDDALNRLAQRDGLLKAVWSANR